MISFPFPRRFANIGRPESTSTFLFSPVEHFELFGSAMSGRDVYSPRPEGGDPGVAEQMAAMGKIFQAQLIKDYAMALAMKKTMDQWGHELDHSTRGPALLIALAGRAHIQHYHGIPQILRWLRGGNLEDVEKEEMMICAQMMYDLDLDEREQRADDTLVERTILEHEATAAPLYLAGAASGRNSDGEKPPVENFAFPIADVLYVYDEEDWHEEGGGASSAVDQSSSANSTKCPQPEESAMAHQSNPHGKGVKQETAAVYDRVGATAALPGNAGKARAILTYLGYTEEQQRWEICCPVCS